MLKLIRRAAAKIVLWYAIDKMNRKQGAFIEFDVDIISIKKLRIGRGVQIQSGSYLHCGGLEWSDFAGHISISDRTFIGPRCVLFGAGGIEIGADVLISPAVKIMSHAHSFQADRPVRVQPLRFSKVKIMDNVYIGANATILPGVTVGEGAVIGAGSVVSRDIPPFSVALGVPARVIRKLHESGSHRV